MTRETMSCWRGPPPAVVEEEEVDASDEGAHDEDDEEEDMIAPRGLIRARPKMRCMACD